MGRKIGYARVSTDEQNTNMQLDALKREGCETIYIEHVSGSVRDRPELARMMAEVTKGDTVVVYKLDRLGRSTGHLIELLDQLGARGVQFKSVQESIDTSSVYGQALFGMLAVFAQLERDVIRERIRDGVKARIERGERHGKECRYTEAEIAEMVRMKVSKCGLTMIAKHFNCSRQNVSYLTRRAMGRSARK